MRGLNHHVFIPMGQTDNKEYYLRRLPEGVPPKCRALWANKRELRAIDAAQLSENSASTTKKKHPQMG